MHEFFKFEPAWQQTLILLILVVVALCVHLLVSRVVAWQARLILGRQGNEASRRSLKRVAFPVGVLAAVGATFWGLSILDLDDQLLQVVVVALRVLAALAVVMLAFRIIDVGSDVFAKRAERTETKLDDQLVPLVRKALKAFAGAIAILFVLQNLDVDIGSLLAGASLGGLAFTLAAKDTVANLFGSISIFTDRPFQIGDSVVIDGHEGVVTEVGMRSTRIRTYYRSVVTVPNAIVANAAIDNWGLRESRRVRTTIGLTYDTTPDQMQRFVEGTKKVLDAHSKVASGNYEVHFNEFGESALNIFLQFFVETREWSVELATRQEVFLELMKLAEEVGVSFAFPTRTLHVESFPHAKQ